MENTIKNLAKAFVGESQARNRYTMYSKIARDEGFEQIAEIFLLTADNERVHAKNFFKLINELKLKNPQGSYNPIIIETAVPTTMGTTIENLKSAIAGENEEYTKLYPEFANMAEQEGLVDMATRIRAIMVAEQHHEERYLKLLEVLESGKVFKKDIETHWVCRECGYVHFGTTPPDKCPSCDHEENFYQVKCETY